MRQLVFFDLPTTSPQERKDYRKFRKFLIDEGFLMLQFSVYSKLTLNDTQANTVIRRIEKNKPKNGSVVVLKVTEKQFANMYYVIGTKDQTLANSDARIVFLGKK
jgi:CRISPR-associated protein Cas2